jgi:hypothetical protein
MKHTTEWLRSQYRNAVASGRLCRHSTDCQRGQYRNVDPTLPRYGTDCAAHSVVCSKDEATDKATGARGRQARAALSGEAEAANFGRTKILQ